jgi:hypothetical protein
MKPYKQFKPFQIRLAERMGEDKKNPYLIRWTLLFFGYSIRLHHWIGSDEERFFHDHPWNFTSFLLKGSYANVTPNGRTEVKAPFHWHSSATDQHYLDIPKEGAWTILVCSKPYHKWGFYVNGHKWRPLRFFHKYGGKKCNKNAVDNVKVV